jgi:hypothetical protein
MARLRLSEWMAEGGGSWLYASFMGGFIVALRKWFIPAAGAKTDPPENPTKHYTALCDLLFTISEQMENVSSFVIYRDGADAHTEFRVLPFSVLYAGVECSYAGGAAIGGLVASTAKYIYADLSAAPTITIVVADAWPAATYPHIRGGVLTAPASGPWKPANLVRKTMQQSLAIPGDVGTTVELNFTHASSSPLPILTVQAGRWIESVVVKVNTLFDGAPTLTVGDAGDTDRLRVSTVWTPGTAGTYEVRWPHKYAASAVVNLYFAGGGATVGDGTVIVK